MLRIAVLLLIVCLIWRWALGSWPWDSLRAKPTRSQALFRARKLLGVQERASREEIKAAHKRLVAMVHPDKGGSNAQVHEANQARDLLLSELPDPGANIATKDPSQD